MTEQLAVDGYTAGFALKLNTLFADGWRLVPGALTSAASGSHSPLLCAVLERVKPEVQPATPDPRPTSEPRSASGRPRPNPTPTYPPPHRKMPPAIPDEPPRTSTPRRSAWWRFWG